MVPICCSRDGGGSVKRLLLGPVLLALLVRVLYWVFTTPGWQPDSDADQYLQIARNLADGHGYSLVFPQLELHSTAFRPPLYPALLAVPSAIFGDNVLWPARLLSLLLSLGVVALTVLFVRRIAGDLAGLVAGCGVALMPSLIANDTVSVSEPLGLLLLVGLLLALLDRRPVVAGILSGGLILARPNAYLVVLISAAFLWHWLGIKEAAMCVACAVVLVMPWVVRNRVQVDTWSVTTSQGFTLAAIYGPDAQERGRFVDPVFDKSYDDSDFRLLQFNEGEWNSRLTALAVSSAVDQPGYVLKTVWHNLESTLELDTASNEIAERIDGRNLGFRNATLPLFFVYLVAGTAGLGARIKDDRIWPAYLIVGQFLILSLLTVAPPRLRAPLDLLLCMGVGFLAAELMNLWRTWRSGVPVSDQISHN